PVGAETRPASRAAGSGRPRRRPELMREYLAKRISTKCVGGRGLKPSGLAVRSGSEPLGPHARAHRGGVRPLHGLLTLTATGRACESVLSAPAGLNVAVGTTGSATFSVGTSITLSAPTGPSVLRTAPSTSGG